MLLLLLDTDVQVPKRSPRARSIILTAKAAMAGGKQLFEGAHLTDGNTRFCRKSSKCRNYALFVGQISVKFSGLKMYERKKNDKYQVCHQVVNNGSLSGHQVVIKWSPSGHQAGVSIIFKIRVFYKARFEGFEFFIRWPYAVFCKMQVVF